MNNINPGSGVWSHDYFSWITTRYRNQIAVTGTSGVGKTSLAKKLKEKLDVPDSGFKKFLSAGDLFRRRAGELGFPTVEGFIDHLKVQPTDVHDLWCDGQIMEAAKADGVLSEGRMAHICMPHGFHVRVICSLDVCAARRVDERKNISPKIDFDTIRRSMEERNEADRARYERLYPGSGWSLSCFDLVIDSNTMSLADEVDLVLTKHTEWLSGAVHLHPAIAV